jgi:hypothetical protein
MESIIIVVIVIIIIIVAVITTTTTTITMVYVNINMKGHEKYLERTQSTILEKHDSHTDIFHSEITAVKCLINTVKFFPAGFFIFFSSNILFNL